MGGSTTDLEVVLCFAIVVGVLTTLPLPRHLVTIWLPLRTLQFYNLIGPLLDLLI